MERTTRNKVGRKVRMERRVRAWIAGAIAAVAAHAAVAQNQGSAAPSAAAEPDIVVVGDKGQKRQVRTFVDALSVPARASQIGRLEDGICPRSFGLSERDNAMFARRMRRIAKAAGIPLADEECSANIVLFVVPDKKAAIAHWRVSRPDFFDGLLPREIKAVADQEGPVAAWQIVRLKGEGRRAIAEDRSGANAHYVLDHVQPGRIGTRIQAEFQASFLIIEAAALGEATLVQVADYAAMRTFAKTDPDAAAAQATPTILSLFEPGREAHAPLSVTQWDLSFLKALYESRPAYRAADQERAIARSLREHMEHASEGAERE